MNVERWVRSRCLAWQRLEELLRQIDRRGLSTLDADQLHELGRLYRAVSADLSRARALNMGGDIPRYLNNLVVKAHNQVYQRPRNRWVDFVNFLWVTFPELVRRHIVYVVVAFAIFFLPAVGCYSVTLTDSNFPHMEVVKDQPLVSEEMWHMIQQKQMWTDPAQHYSPLISSQIASNNIRVALLAFALGVTLGLGTVWVLLVNGMTIGTIFGACALSGLDRRLMTFVAPHGVLELTAIFICGGGGLLIGRALLFPGQLRRSDALRAVARDAMGLFAGCVPVLLLAGAIEGFISPRTDLSAQAKLAVSLSTLILMLLYLFVPRRRLGKRE